MSRRCSAFLAAFLSVAGLAAPTLHAQDKPATTTPAPAAPAEQPPLPEITVLDAGQADGRVQLRFTPKVGDSQTVVMRMKVDTAAKINGQANPATSTPGTAVTMKVTVAEITTDGDIKYGMAIVDAVAFDTENVPQPTVAAINKSLSDMKQLKGDVVMSNRGIVKSAVFKGDNSNPMLKNMIEGMNQTASQFSVPLPNEAVGVGAKWEVKAKPTLSGVKAETTTTYTLNAREGTVLTFDVTQVVKVEEQDVQSPMLAPGSKLRVKSMSGTGKGKLTLNTSRVVTDDAELSSKTDARMEVSMQGQTMNMEQETRVDVSFKAPEGAAAK